MIRDQLVEKTSSARIRERLLLEDKLTLEKAMAIAAQIENAVAEAKIIASSRGAAEDVVGMVRGHTFHGGKQRQQKHSNFGPSPPPKTAVLTGSTAAGKRCYRCGSSTHVATEPLHTAYRDCSVLQQVMVHLRNGWPLTAKGLDAALLPFYCVQTELAELDEVLVRGTHRVVIPPALQPRLIQLAHETYQGMVRTKQRLRERWWPGMDSDVEAAIKSCTTCSQHD